MSTTIPIHSTATIRRRVTRKGIPPAAAPLPAPQSVTMTDFRSAFGIDGAKDDLDQIPTDFRTGAFAFLLAYRNGLRYLAAAAYARIRPWQLTRARRCSKTYRDQFDSVREGFALLRSIELEEKLVALANGEVERRKGRLDPDVRALQTFLAANDAKYKPGAAAPVTAISISLNI